MKTRKLFYRVLTVVCVLCCCLQCQHLPLWSQPLSKVSKVEGQTCLRPLAQR